MKCSYCDAPSVGCTTVPVGQRPDDPLKLGTQADPRKIIVVRMCAEHAPSGGRVTP